MTKRTCSTDGCERTHVARGFCSFHYRQARRLGCLGIVRPPNRTPEERFWAKVAKTDDCWNWTGAISGGYGMFAFDAKTTGLAHRFSYELLVGRIPEGKFIDHRCHNTRCVNPEHLRPVTNKQNIENHNGARSISKSGIRGVWQCADSPKWRAQVCHKGQKYWLGRFDTAEEAAAAVTAKRNELHTHNDRDREGEAA